MVSTASNTYAYCAMMETLLTYGFDAKTSHLTSGLFYKDTPGNMDAVDPTLDDDNANLGLKKQSQFTAESGEIDLVGMIHADIFCQEKFLLSGFDLKLKPHRSKNEFCVVSGFQPLQQMPEYKVQIMDATVFIRSCKLNPTLTVSHAFVRESLFKGQIPRRIVFGLMDNTAYNGAYAKNPFQL